MEKFKRILEPYYKEIEAGNMPSFQSIMEKYNNLLNDSPTSDEVGCLTALLVTLYPVEFQKGIYDKLKEMGFVDAMREAGNRPKPEEGC